MLLRTPQDFWEIACSCAAEEPPTPGISRSITYFGIIPPGDSDIRTGLPMATKSPPSLFPGCQAWPPSPHRGPVRLVRTSIPLAKGRLFIEKDEQVEEQEDTRA